MTTAKLIEKAREAYREVSKLAKEHAAAHGAQMQAFIKMTTADTRFREIMEQVEKRIRDDKE